MGTIKGFSKLNKSQKIEWVSKNYLKNDKEVVEVLKRYWNTDLKTQKLHEEFAENTISNYYLPFGLAPNFCIDGKLYCLPMVIEESSVIAAVSKAAKFWEARGGFTTTVLGTTKVGHVHFMYNGDFHALQSIFEKEKATFITDVKEIIQNMQKRGGGVMDIQLVNKTKNLKGYYQLHCTFETADAMGANFINSCLEQFGKTLKKITQPHIQLEVVMCILSNYVPNCRVKAEVSCPIEELASDKQYAHQFAQKFIQAINIANVEPYRAVTHNKGIMNGIDAIVIATGNDFRAIEAGVHAYASRDGRYQSLTQAEIIHDQFRFWIDIPIAVGTVGGLTSLHPLVKVALSILDNPNADELMRIIAVAGLAQNFAAVQSLVTTGIQKGHMKMHLLNILNQLYTTDSEKEKAQNHFQNNPVTHSAVVDFIKKIRA